MIRIFLIPAIITPWIPDAFAKDELNPTRQEALKLRYDTPAKKWVEALPIGNGRLGAMVFGGPESEQLQLNEGTLWSGGPKDWNNPNAKTHLQEIRKALFAGDYHRANELARKQQGPYTQSYQPLGDLRLTFPHSSDEVKCYERTLDLDRAVVTTRYTFQGVTYSREVFSSFPDQVIVVRLSADRPASISLQIGANSPLKSTIDLTVPNTLHLRVKAPSQVEPNYRNAPNPIVYDEGSNAEGMTAELHVLTKQKGGTSARTSDSLSITGADDVTLLLSAATSYNGSFKSPSREGLDPGPLAAGHLSRAAARTDQELLARHLADHQMLFRRVSLDLGTSANASSLTIPERLARYQTGQADPELEVLLYQYGRYLLIASSRPGGMPANLQGIWNDSMRPPWSSNYTLNINAEMNYWPAEVANLAECHQPLFDHIARLAVNGAKTARINYGARGWVAHHNTDIWAQTAPVGAYGEGDPVWANWQMGGAWLTRHLWEHYDYGRDVQFLRNTAWPLMQGAAEFCLDWLVEDPQGRLVTAPSSSPEASFHVPGGGVAGVAVAGVAVAATMDMSIIRDLFSNVLAAAKVLGIQDDFSRRIAAAHQNLHPLQIGSRSQLQEWAADLTETDLHHRHTSHLFGLYPGREISSATPQFFAASRRTLELRGDESTGWALGWRVNLWARLLDGNKAHVFVRNLLRPVKDSEGTNYAAGGGVYPNLFDAHPPFQIDGNFGYTSGVSEMLLQSHLGSIDVLPALPSVWRSGSVRGLRARGGHEVNMVWKDHRLETVTVSSKRGGDLVLRWGSAILKASLSSGQSRTWKPEDFKR